MFKSPTPFLVLAFICLAIGLFGSHGVVDGLGKAMFGVFMITFFIIRFFGGQEA